MKKFDYLKILTRLKMFNYKFKDLIKNLLIIFHIIFFINYLSKYILIKMFLLFFIQNSYLKVIKIKFKL